jgi:hypothetical protein
MKLPIAASLALAASLLSTAALADPVVAKLQKPTPSPSKPIAGDAVFECLGDVCAARTPSGDTATVRGCKSLVRQVGPVSAFGSAAKPLTSEQITACNESAGK